MHSMEVSLEDYGIDNLNFWLTHERFAFDLRNSQEMSSPFIDPSRFLRTVQWQVNCLRMANW